ncbi:hypothetical protein [Rathayibacter rathayi]|uniref:hypothetical protein n=1 Tax=Rathayibacter rathayi TaxID=33887 RepID=UPI000D4D9A22|nr:hypothetical protein [Rathayibacter rathayi]PPG09826.1 hypothetical protein C5C11_14945 [Rathayibacter rathayi]
MGRASAAGLDVVEGAEATLAPLLARLRAVEAALASRIVESAEEWAALPIGAIVRTAGESIVPAAGVVWRLRDATTVILEGLVIRSSLTAISPAYAMKNDD